MAILVVDDEPSIRYVLRSLLQDEGYEVIVASNGREALGVLRSCPGIEAVLLDLFMPEMGGKCLLAVMREDQALVKIPVLILSGAVRRPEDFPPASHYQAVIEKPFDLEDVLSAVGSLIRAASPVDGR